MKTNYEGWSELLAELKVGDQVVRKWMAYYNFPRPVFVRVRSRAVKTWPIEDVLGWVNNNMALLTAARTASIKYTNKRFGSGRSIV
jgi:hypothetical protein